MVDGGFTSPKLISSCSYLEDIEGVWKALLNAQSKERIALLVQEATLNAKEKAKEINNNQLKLFDPNISPKERVEKAANILMKAIDRQANNRKS